MVIIETCNDVTANLWKRLCLAACALFLAVPAAAGASAVTGSRPGQLPIMDAETGQVLTSQELAARETDMDVLFLGEFHDNASIHETEAALLQDLYKQKQGKLALSLEMAERDTQPVLDSYLAEDTRRRIPCCRAPLAQLQGRLPSNGHLCQNAEDSRNCRQYTEESRSRLCPYRLPPGGRRDMGSLYAADRIFRLPGV